MTHILLTPEDVIQEGDEYWDGKWLKAYEGDFGQHPINALTWRRPIAPPKWIEVKSGVLPKPGQPIWVLWNDGDINVIMDGLTSPSGYFKSNHCVVSWLPATIPEPPKAEPSEAERAWAEDCKTFACGDCDPCIGGRADQCAISRTKKDKESFLAGFHAGKEKGK